MKGLIASLIFLPIVAAQGQIELKQVSMGKWSVPPANYSGITHLGEDDYALVSDKETTDGYYPFRIVISRVDGTVLEVRRGALLGNKNPKLDANGMSTRDTEGIVYHPSSKTYFISGEGDQQILEYGADGALTGRKLNIPTEFSLANITPNYGFEALAYNEKTGLFWTTTESTLPSDGPCTSATNALGQNVLRLQSFGENLEAAAQYAYRMEGASTTKFGKTYCYGVPTITALPDGSLLVMEREANITQNYIGSVVTNRIFRVYPQQGKTITAATKLTALSNDVILPKMEVARFSTRFSLTNQTFANYEGMCLGPKLDDGRQTLLLINDSQAGYGNELIHLRDYVKVFILPQGFIK
ncbi:MAG: esterase-like activity of phytase family protein [Bacteroidaceae bacterium]